MAYQFPDDLQNFLNDELRRGNYESEEHLFADLLRMLKREREEALEGIRAGLEDVKAGRTRPAEEVFNDLRNKYNIPDEE